MVYYSLDLLLHTLHCSHPEPKEGVRFCRLQEICGSLQDLLPRGSGRATSSLGSFYLEAGVLLPQGSGSTTSNLGSYYLKARLLLPQVSGPAGTSDARSRIDPGDSRRTVPPASMAAAVAAVAAVAAAEAAAEAAMAAAVAAASLDT